MNPQRISNPFTPSSEPDWVMLPKSSVPQGLMKTKSEAGTSKSGIYNVAAEPGKLILSEAHASNRGLPSIQKRRIETQNPAVAAPSKSSFTRGPAPPIPRKPIEFVISNERNLELSPSETLDSAPSLSVQPQVIGSTLIHPPSINALPVSDKALPASHQWSIPYSPATSSVRLPYQQQAGPTLALPKNPAQASSGSSGLLDDDNVGAQYIPSLQPICRS